MMPHLRAVAVLLVLSLGLSACAELTAPPEPPTEAELAQDRQDQLDNEIERYRKLDIEEYTVSPIDEPITERVLTTSLSELYIDGFSMCTNVTFAFTGATPRLIHGKAWGVTIPSGKSYQGSIRNGDDRKFGDRRGEIVLQPGQTRQAQVCLAGADERLGIPGGLYKITHKPALMNTHVWLAVL